MGTPAQRLESERALYPAMQVDEILVWRNWLQLYELEYNLLPAEWIAARSSAIGARPQLGDRFDYNVRVGTNVDPGPVFPQNIRDSAIATRSLRIDAVGFSDGTPVVFEVKRRAGPENIGQLFVYRSKWKNQGITAQTPQLRLVCSDISQHIPEAAAEAGIAVDLVPTNFSFLSPFAARRRTP
jgi:hypothetical protein